MPLWRRPSLHWRSGQFDDRTRGRACRCRLRSGHGAADRRPAATIASAFGMYGPWRRCKPARFARWQCVILLVELLKRKSPKLAAVAADKTTGIAWEMMLPRALGIGSDAGIQQSLAIVIIAGLLQPYLLVLRAMLVLIGWTLLRRDRT
jgi:hypothetical protein